MRILLSGSSGFIGKELVKFLSKYEVIRLVRDPSLVNQQSLYVNFCDLPDNFSSFEGFDAFIHLAGENIAGRWTKAKKRKIADSRIKSTLYLSELIKHIERPPKIFLSASAIGYYGENGDEVLTEHAGNGRGFLCDVCEKWEEAARGARDSGVGVVNMRFGLVLGEGGALKRMLPAFRLGLGGKMGSGEQYVAWIHLIDLIRAIDFLLQNPCIEGPVNICSPQAVRQKEFADLLAKSLHRPCFFTLPAPILKLVFGEMAKDVLLCSTRAYPHVLLQNRFSFLFPGLEQALRDCFKT